MTEIEILAIITNNCATTEIDGKEINILKSPNQLAHELKVRFDNALGKSLLEANNFKNVKSECPFCDSVDVFQFELIHSKCRKCNEKWTN